MTISSAVPGMGFCALEDGHSGDHILKETKIKISLDDADTRAIYENAMQAKREVEAWPAWKRGEPVWERVPVKEEPVPAKRPSKKTAKTAEQKHLEQWGLARNPFKNLGPVQGAKEFMLHVHWSGLDDGDDDGRGHLLRRGTVVADVGLENFPDPPPTDEEMQQVMFAAKMALLKVLRQRKRGKK